MVNMEKHIYVIILHVAKHGFQKMTDSQNGKNKIENQIGIKLQQQLIQQKEKL